MMLHSFLEKMREVKTLDKVLVETVKRISSDGTQKERAKYTTLTNARTSMGVFSQSSSCGKISLRYCSIPDTAFSTVRIDFYLFLLKNKAINYNFIL
jgi:hypothetical protein